MKLYLCEVPGCACDSRWFYPYTLFLDTPFRKDNPIIFRLVTQGVCDMHARQFYPKSWHDMFHKGIVEIMAEGNL